MGQITSTHFRGLCSTIRRTGEWDKGDRMMIFAPFVKIASLAQRSAVACALLMAISLALAGCETATNIMGKQGTGVAEVANQSPQEASANLASLTDVIQRNPSSAEAYNTRGVAYAKIGKFQEAIADFNQSIKLNPNNAASLTNRALAYRGRANLLRVQGKLDEARADLDKAIKLNPENAQAFHARGLIYQREGLHEQAITDFDNAIDRDPFAGAPYQARGQSLIAIGKSDKAIEDFNAALNVDNKNADAWAGLGLAYEKSGNRAKAIESYQRALVFDPNSQIAKDGVARMGRA